MGCMASKTNEGKPNRNIFHVMNVDDEGNKLCPCDLEITDTELILYQKDKTPITWPLRSLRRYGFDADSFSFESGRRCPTGPGIYAFKCRKADQLFNILQLHIQNRSGNEDQHIRSLRQSRDANDIVNGSFDFSHSQLQLNSETSIDNSVNQVEANQSRLVGRSSTYPHFSDRLGSLGNCGVSNHTYDNNSDVLQNSKVNCYDEDSDKENFQAVYVNVLGASGTTVCDNAYYQNPNLDNQEESLSHLYMNVHTERCNAIHKSSKLDDRCYVNINQKNILKLYKPFAANVNDDNLSSVNCDIEGGIADEKQVNYVVLDLDPSGNSTPQVPLSPVESQTFSFSESPRKCSTAMGYTTIDFDKTAALCNSFNPSEEVDAECLRLTRHNVPHHSVKHNSISSE